MVSKIIIDTDPGIDDALALLAACRCREVEIMGVSTVAGNLPLETVTANASAILAFCGSPARVYPGASAPLYGNLRDAAHIHGPGGLGGWDLAPDSGRVDRRHAAEFIAGTAADNPGQVTLVTLGPLTNLALALARYPRQVRELKRVVAMGGALAVPGNVTPVAEFNIWANPNTTQTMIKGGLDLSLVGLDVTRDMRLEDQAIARLEGGGPGARQAACLIRYIEKKEGAHPLHDPLAFTAAIHPEFFTFDLLPLAVEIGGDYCRGQTVPLREGQGYLLKGARRADYRKCQEFLLDLWGQTKG